MDPVTAMLLAACLLAYGAKKVVSDTIVDNNYAKQGLVSPRFEAQHGREAAAKTDKYGFTDFLRDNWRDYWAKSAEARIAARDMQPRVPGEKVRWSDRWVAAKTVVSEAKVKAVAAVKKVIDPVEPQPKSDPTPIVDPLADGTVRFTDAGREQYDAATGEWQPIPDQPTEPTSGHIPRHSADTSTGGTTVTAPTGEAVNYETTVNELEAIAREQRGHIDSAKMCLAAVEQAKAAIDGMQASYRTTAEAARSVNDHLDAMHLDGETLAHVGTVGDAMPPGAVDQMFDHLEGIEARAQEQLKNAEIALASTEAALNRVVSEYGEEAAKVASNLDGDPTFLGNGGTAGTATTQHVAA